MSTPNTQYVDGFVLPVPKAKLAEYQAIAEKAAAIWMEYGALDYRECVGDDMEIPDMLGFPKIAAAKEDETVVFAWITYESREKRDEINAKVMADPRLTESCNPENAPFDCKRMAYGGFNPIVKG
jgi:uncharacterized protein YbaA (DUF1428 family)